MPIFEADNGLLAGGGKVNVHGCAGITMPRRTMSRVQGLVNRHNIQGRRCPRSPEAGQDPTAEDGYMLALLPSLVDSIRPDTPPLRRDARGFPVPPASFALCSSTGC